MASIITWSVGNTSYELKASQYGYTSDLVFPFSFTRVLPKGYQAWDSGSTFDYRICKCSFLMDFSDASDLIDLFVDNNKGRGIDIDMLLPSASGFYPFLPDKGDAGAFSMRLMSIKPGAAQRAPWKFFTVDTEFVGVTYPSYILPTQIKEGPLQIGSVSGLRFPDSWPEPAQDYAFGSVLTGDGTPYSTDGLQGSDHYETELDMICNQSKAAALINHLATVRTSALNIVPGSDGYLFGAENPGATYSCRMVQKRISVTHSNFDRFDFALRFNMISVA